MKNANSQIHILNSGEVIWTDHWVSDLSQRIYSELLNLNSNNEPKEGPIELVDFGFLLGEEPSISKKNKPSLSFYIHGCPIACKTCYQPEFFKHKPRFQSSVKAMQQLILNQDPTIYESLEFVVSGYSKPVYELIKLLKTNSLFKQNIVYKYSGVMTELQIKALAPYVDIFVPDFKSMTKEMAEVHGLNQMFIETTKKNIIYLSKYAKKTIVRHLMVEPFKNHKSEALKVGRFIESLSWSGEVLFSLLNIFFNPENNKVYKVSKSTLDSVVAQLSVQCLYSSEGEYNV